MTGTSSAATPPAGRRLRRLRRRFVLAGLVLLGPLTLLVGRAVWGVEGEYRAHHEAVARRLFDEMERALTDILLAEERRPVAAYAIGADGIDWNGTGPPPYVIGHFEIGPGGGVRALDASTLAALAEPIALYAAERAPTGLDPTGLDGVGWMAPGSTVAHNALPNTSSKLSLSSLNRGADRRGRGARFEASPPPPPPPPEGRHSRMHADVIGPGLRVSLMAGTLVDPGRLVLTRVVNDGAGQRHQGLVVSVALLGRGLIERTLDGSAIEPYASALISSDPQVPSAAEHGFTHRFGQPFDSLGASLVLAPLPDAVDTGWVYGLGLGLLGMAPLGLFALYRMVAVTVRFAERQSDFVSAVTHELKTPLTSIRMYGEMLRDGVVPDPSKRQRYAEHITAEAERLSRLIGNVLELARLENGRRPMNPTVGDAGDALRAVAELFGPQARAAGFELVVEAPAGLPAVRVDRDVLVQVIFNLVDNAVKYARDAADRRIVLRAAPLAGNGVALIVRDHGPGVPARQLRQIFEPFYRGQRELTRTATGTGIGLSLVRGLVERMGGAVAAKNPTDGGFEVRITLPGAA